MKTMDWFQRNSLLCIVTLFAFPAALQAQVDWTEYQNNPVLTKSAGSWDSGVVLAPTVIQSGDTLKMWYVGAESIFSPSTIGIGYAFSVDGKSWTKYSGNPVMKGRPGMWDQPGVLLPIVIQDGDTLRMWYAGGSGPDHTKMGYATSVDGVNWSRHPTPVMQTGSAGAWNADTMLPGSVIKEGGVFSMWFTGGVGGISMASPNIKTGVGYATSPDGVNWTLYDDPATTAPPYHLSDPVLNHGDAGEWDANEMFAPSVIKGDSGYEMWYSGWRAGGDGQHIGYATSPDGIQWTKHLDNPVFREGTWNNGNVFPSVILDGGQYRMWYQGWQSSSASIGYATASVEDTGTALEDTPTGLPDRFTLHQNYPNPFNPSTTIRYEVHRPGHLILAIYNVLGQRVRTLVDAQQAAGERSVVWDGRNDQGEVMASGVYFSRMQVGDVVQNRAMLLVN